MSKELFGNPSRVYRPIDASKRLEWVRVVATLAQIGLGAFVVWAMIVLMAAAGGRCF